MKMLISERLSKNKYKTSEGYLICTDAILARTGKQTYLKDEIFNDGDTTEIEVDRPYNEVMNEKTISSFENKPITFEHPNEDVNVGNYKHYSIGYVRDVKQGRTDNGEDVLLGNLVITDQDAINAIESGEYSDLSCGYDCDIRDDNGYYQHCIRGNHVALCKEGRAGIARIVDSKTNDNNIDDMAIKNDNVKVLQEIEQLPKVYKRNNNNIIFVIKPGWTYTKAEGYASKDAGNTWYTARSREVKRTNSSDSRHQNERRFSSTNNNNPEIPFSHIVYCLYNNITTIPNETIDHLDGDHMNDNPNNLEAVSNSENIRRMKKTFTSSKDSISKIIQLVKTLDATKIDTYKGINIYYSNDFNYYFMINNKKYEAVNEDEAKEFIDSILSNRNKMNKYIVYYISRRSDRQTQYDVTASSEIEAVNKVKKLTNDVYRVVRIEKF